MLTIAIIGRTKWLLDSAKILHENGYKIAAVITAPAAPEYDIKEVDFEQFASFVGAPFLLTKSINNLDTINWIKNIGDIDICVSINFTGVIQNKVISLFRLGILNGHGGDLPRYRGNACQAWALINGEKQIAMCVHKMIPGELDSGDIIARSYLEVDINTRISQVYAWMSDVTPLLVLEAVTMLAKDGDFILEKQSTDAQDALRCYPRMPIDGVIDWSCHAEDVVRLVNASSEPFSGAFCKFNDEVLVVWRAHVACEKSPYLAVLGQILEINKTEGEVEVACGHGSSVVITEVEKNGVRYKPSELIKSIRNRLY